MLTFNVKHFKAKIDSFLNFMLIYFLVSFSEYMNFTALTAQSSEKQKVQDLFEFLQYFRYITLTERSMKAARL